MGSKRPPDDVKPQRAESDSALGGRLAAVHDRSQWPSDRLEVRHHGRYPALWRALLWLDRLGSRPPRSGGLPARFRRKRSLVRYEPGRDDMFQDENSLLFSYASSCNAGAIVHSVGVPRGQLITRPRYPIA